MDITQGATARAESVPPNVVCTNQSSYLPRAQSEQPLFQNFGQPQQQQANAAAGNVAATSPFRQYTNTCQNVPISRNLQGARLLRHSNALLNSRQIAPQQQQQSQSLTQPYYETDQSFSNNYLNPQNPDQSILLNNDPNSPLLNITSAGHVAQSPIFIHHNNNTAASGTVANNNNANNNNAVRGINNTASGVFDTATGINNLQHQQNVVNTVTSTVPTTSSAAAINNNHNNNMNNSRAFSPHVPALNNQVPPGNLTRANNYWDNFRR